MAAVSSKGTVAKKAPVAKTATKASAKPKGLQLSAAQWKAYNKAYSASTSAQAFKASVGRFRKYRLQAAVAKMMPADTLAEMQSRQAAPGTALKN